MFLCPVFGILQVTIELVIYVELFLSIIQSRGLGKKMALVNASYKGLNTVVSGLDLTANIIISYLSSCAASIGEETEQKLGFFSG